MKLNQKKFVTNNQWTTRGMTVAERFWSKVEKSDNCWRWLAGTTPEGYGLFCRLKEWRARKQANR